MRASRVELSVVAAVSAAKIVRRQRDQRQQSEPTARPARIDLSNCRKAKRRSVIIGVVVLIY